MARKPSAERTLPHDLTAEKCVLGAILVHPELMMTATEFVGTRDFFRDAHQRIFAAMETLVDRGDEIDFVTVKAELIGRGDLEEVGGAAYLAGLSDGVPRAMNIRHYATLVREASSLRRTIETATRLVAAAYDPGARATDLVTEAVERLSDVGEAARGGQPISLADLSVAGTQAIEKAQEMGRGGVTGLASGFPGLDDMTAGFQPSDLVLIAGRTSQGKTALALQIAKLVAADETVLFFSLEMSKEQLYVRLLASEARVNSHRLRAGHLLDPDWAKISTAICTLSAAKLYIDDSSGISTREIRSRARKMRAEYGLGMIVVDYIGLMRGHGRFENRTQEIGTISRGLKAIAKEMSVPVLALSQLSRAAENRDGRKPRRPQLSDLRESGDLEQDADVVIFIHQRPEDDCEGLVELIVAKQRNGPQGMTKAIFSEEYVRFDNLPVFDHQPIGGTA